MKNIPFICVAAAALSFVHAAKAADGLYAAAPPPGSAFVRFIGDAEGVPAIRGKSYHAVGAGEVAPYHAVPSGDAPVAFGGVSAKTVLEPGKYYSATKTDGKLVVQPEPAFANRLKTQLVLINLTGGGVSLKTADGAVDVLGGVPARGLSAREVNAVKAGFAVYAGADKVGDLAPRALDRGASYAVVVYTGRDGKPAVGYGKAGLQ